MDFQASPHGGAEANFEAQLWNLQDKIGGNRMAL
jgi:hypothetical protein